MRLLLLVLYSFTALLLVSCAGSVSIKGQTAAGDILQADTIKSLTRQLKYNKECTKMDYIEVSPVRVSSLGAGESGASKQYGNIEEQWVVNGCGGRFPYKVVFTPDGVGGTFIQVGPER